MEINEFIIQFKGQFIDGDELTIEPATEFRQIGSWDSLTGMSVIVMIEDNYGIIITPDELKQCNTANDLFELVKTK
jgi:acyl carrier protein